MSELKTVDIDSFCFAPFHQLQKDWMLITAEYQGHTNSMTASWGGFGILWNKPVALMYIRPTRFTKTLVDQSDSFSLAFFDHSQNQAMLNYMGSVSGRDEDKIAHCGLRVEHQAGTPYFPAADLVFLCRKLHSQPLDPKGFQAAWIDTEEYAKKDYHTLYIGEITAIMKREERK